MNEYKKALNNLYNNELVKAMNPFMKDNENYLLLQGLTDRETPMKPVNDDQCGSCKVMVIVFNGYRLSYCPNCGQKADWSDKD